MLYEHGVVVIQIYFIKKIADASGVANRERGEERQRTDFWHFDCPGVRRNGHFLFINQKLKGISYTTPPYTPLANDLVPLRLSFRPFPSSYYHAPFSSFKSSPAFTQSYPSPFHRKVYENFSPQAPLQVVHKLTRVFAFNVAGVLWVPLENSGKTMTEKLSYALKK